MIVVSILRGDNTYKLVSTGHAGFATHGSDIVCSAVSILVVGLANELKKHKEFDEIDTFNCNLKRGNATIEVEGIKADCIDHFFEFVIDDLCELAVHYPKHLQVNLCDG